MRKFYVKATMMDPYPKHFETTVAAGNPGLAAKRAWEYFRKNELARKQIKQITFSVTALTIPKGQTQIQ